MTIDVQDIAIPIDRIELEGSLALPTRAAGLVIFAHGSGSSRHRPRNRHVAELLNERGLATLLFDLLTAEEERIDEVDATLRFDVDMLAERLVAATDSMVAATLDEIARPAGSWFRDHVAAATRAKEAS